MIFNYLNLENKRAFIGLKIQMNFLELDLKTDIKTED